jgi:hypothetical protein
VYNLVSACANKSSSVWIQAGVSPASWKCSEEFFSHQIKSRDPLKLGFVSAVMHFVDISIDVFVLFYMVLIANVLLIIIFFFLFFSQWLQVSKYLGFAVSAPSITLGRSKFSLQL